jgi:hypothetical protein
MNAAAVLAHINQQRGAGYRIVGKYREGESGAASQVADAAGNRYVLKVSAGGEFRAENAARATSRLRALGYPTPEYVEVGKLADVSYSLQRTMRGRPIGPDVAITLLPQILRLNDLQRGQGKDASEEPERIIRGVMKGYADYCVIDTLRTYSNGTAELLRTLQRIVEAHASACPRRNDIVHFDFHTNNVLIDGDTISGVIDWEGSRSGDCAFDLATMLFYIWPFTDFRDALLRALLERTTRGAVVVYLAHMIVRQLDWSMRHHPKDAVDRYLETARAILHTLDEV